ncbi:acetylesterase [Cohnella sp. CIP 111063]|nr:acetylesterase [Cohnella sp. CIP 111063]
MQQNPERTISIQQIDEYWNSILQKQSLIPLLVSRETQNSPYSTVRVDKLTFQGFDETPVHSWLLLPRQELEVNPLPCVIVYQGYMGDRGLPDRYAPWLLRGFAVLAVDARGQGGQTGSCLPLSEGWVKGWVTQGICHIDESYYKAIILDAVRAIDAAAAQPEIDKSHLAAVGGSQGGGLALLTAALHPQLGVCVADIPNMCHLEYGLMHSTGSLSEIAAYLKRYPERLPAIRQTLAHVDLLNLVHRISIPVMISVGWKDAICLPETIYALYNRLDAPKQLIDYPFSGHEVSEHQHSLGMDFVTATFRNQAKTP